MRRVETVDHLLPATPRGAPAEAPGRADLLAAVEEEDALQVDFLSHLLVPALKVVLVPREAVDEKVVLKTIGHGPLQETAGDLDRDDCTVGNVVLYQLSELNTSSDQNLTLGGISPPSQAWLSLP